MNAYTIPSPQCLCDLLLQATKYSARAIDLMDHAEEKEYGHLLVDAIYPESSLPALDFSDRALMTVQEIRAAIATFNPDWAGFFTMVLALDVDDSERPICATDRFIEAARKYFKLGDSTARQGNWKTKRVRRLAVRLHERLRERS